MKSDNDFGEYVKILFIGLAVILVMMLVSPGFASERDKRDDNIAIGIGEADAEANSKSKADSSSEADAASDATASSESSGGEGGTANVSTKNESTSLVLSGARDTAQCFTKVTIGAEGFGIGFSRSDTYCKKVRLVSRQLNNENWDAAARLECTLKEWREIYGKDKEACRLALWAGPPEIDENSSAALNGDIVVLASEEYDLLVMAQVQQEEFKEAVEQTEYRYAQQQSEITVLKEEHEADDEEIKELKAKAAALEREQQEQREKEEYRRIKLSEIANRLEKKNE